MLRISLIFTAYSLIRDCITLEKMAFQSSDLKFCFIIIFLVKGAIYLKLHPEKHLLRSLAHVQLSLGILIVPTALYFVLFKGGGG